MREFIVKRSLINQYGPLEDCGLQDKPTQGHLWLSVSQSLYRFVAIALFNKVTSISWYFLREYFVMTSQLWITLEK